MWGIFNAAATHLSTWRLALWWSASHTLHVWRQDPQMKRRISDHRIHQKSSIPKPWPGQWTPEVQIKWFGTHSERKKPKSSCKILGTRVDTWLRLRIDDHLWLISSEKFAAQTASTPALCVPKSSKTLNQVMKDEQVTSQVRNTSFKKKCPGSLPCQFWPSGPSQSSSMQWRGATELVSCIGISQGINQRLPNSRRAMRWSPRKGWWITQCFTASRVHLGCFNAAPHCGDMQGSLSHPEKWRVGFPQCWVKLTGGVWALGPRKLRKDASHNLTPLAS